MISYTERDVEMASECMGRVTHTRSRQSADSRGPSNTKKTAKVSTLTSHFYRILQKNTLSFCDST